MTILGNKIVTVRGEAFGLSFELTEKDGTPYVLLDSIKNPYAKISIADTSYRQDGRYKLNLWIDLSGRPSFKSKIPVLISSEQLESNELPEDYDTNSCIFYIVTSNASREYYYYSENSYLPYSFILDVTILNAYSRDWIEGKYTYSIDILGGTLTYEVLGPLYKATFPTRTYIPSDNRTLYYEIKECNPSAVKRIRPEQPIVNFTYNELISKPEWLIVKTNN